MKRHVFQTWASSLAFGLTLILLGGCASPRADKANASASAPYSFAITCDMRQFTAPDHPGLRYFDGACAALREVGEGAFMVIPGDFDPPERTRATLDRFFGTNYPCYAVAGNHEAETEADMIWLRQWARNGIPGLVRSGPPGAETTMYSFEYGNSHFIAFNQYYDGTKDTELAEKAGQASLDWLAADLAATEQPLIWIIGHEPIVSQPDMDTGRMRHEHDSMNADPALRDQFVQLLNQHEVTGFICGHTHNASVAKVEGIWQLDAGHARGIGDKGSPSTFLKVRVKGEQAWVEVYRADANGENYRLRKTVDLADAAGSKSLDEPAPSQRED